MEIHNEYVKLLLEDMNKSEEADYVNEAGLKQQMKLCLLRNAKCITRLEKLRMIANQITHVKVSKDI